MQPSKSLTVATDELPGPVYWATATPLLLTSPSTEEESARLDRIDARLRAESKTSKSWIQQERAVLRQQATEPKTNATPVGFRKGVWKEHTAATTVFVAASTVAVMLACTVLRTHLFIWTVFSPKYLYAMAWAAGWHLIVNVGIGAWLWGLEK